MSVQIDQLFIRDSDIEPYAPSGHSGTMNRRLVGPDQGATHMEALVGTIEPGHGATPHLHPGIEQFCYLLEGEAEVTIGDITRTLVAGEACFFPADMRHVFIARGDTPVRVLVVYSPPYGEGARVEA